MVAGSRVATNCGVNTLSVRPATGGAAFSATFGRFRCADTWLPEALRLALGYFNNVRFWPKADISWMHRCLLFRSLLGVKRTCSFALRMSA